MPSLSPSKVEQMPPTPRSRTKRRRPKSPGPRVNLKKLRENLQKELEIHAASPMPAVLPPIKGGAHARRLRSITRRIRKLPKNVEFVGFMNKEQATAMAGH